MTSNADPMFAGSSVRTFTIDMIDKNGNLVVKNVPEKAVVLFYASWCGACKGIKDNYKRFAAEAKGMKNTYVGAMDFDAATNNLKMNVREWPFQVKGYPTLISFSNGQPYSIYTGDRSPQDLLEFTRHIGEKWGSGR